MMAAALTAGMIGASCSNNGDKDTAPTDKYGTPYDRAIGNGNYILHNFISDNDNIKRDTAVDDVNHYLELGEDYINGMLDGFSKSLNSRPTAKNYFNDMITNIQNANNDKFHITSGSINMDAAMNNILRHTAPALADITKNVNSYEQQDALQVCYRTLRNEAHKEGLGKSRNDVNNTLLEPYEEEKESIMVTDSFDDMPILKENNVNFTEAYRTNDFTAITNLLDKLFATAAGNMSTKKGIDVTAADLRQIANLNFAVSSLRGMHDYTQNLVGHQKNCVAAPYQDIEAIYNASYGELATQYQSQGQELGM